MQGSSTEFGGTRLSRERCPLGWRVPSQPAGPRCPCPVLPPGASALHWPGRAQVRGSAPPAPAPPSLQVPPPPRAPLQGRRPSGPSDCPGRWSMLGEGMAAILRAPTPTVGDARLCRPFSSRATRPAAPAPGSALPGWGPARGRLSSDWEWPPGPAQGLTPRLRTGPTPSSSPRPLQHRCSDQAPRAPPGPGGPAGPPCSSLGVQPVAAGSRPTRPLGHTEERRQPRAGRRADRRGGGCWLVRHPPRLGPRVVFAQVWPLPSEGALSRRPMALRSRVQGLRVPILGPAGASGLRSSLL